MITNINSAVYDSKYYWDININPNATISNCLPNCTTLVYGAVLQSGHLPLVRYIKNAGCFDEVLTNGWIAKEYDKDKLEIGDVIEWKDKNHVAIVSKIEENKVIISGSYYTGEHGKSIYNGSYDPRTSFASLEQVNDFMLLNYPTRYFHCWDIDEEMKRVGGLPELMLMHPLYSVKRDTTRNQIEVLTFEQNVRDEHNNIVRKAEKGFFNILSTKNDGSYTWYEVEKNRYIAGVEGRVVYLEANNGDDMNALKEENKQLKEDMSKIMDIARKRL